MPKNDQNYDLTGIERDLVLQYLMDGNVPVTLTPIDESQLENKVHSIPSQIFPVALKPDHLKVHKNGKINLHNPPQSVLGFLDKTVKVEFYFNRVGLFFISKVTQEKNNLTIFIPKNISRIKEVVEEPEYDFSAQLYFEFKNKKELNFKAIPWDKEELFTRPVWKSIPLENQHKAKDYLESFVEIAKTEKNIGNGLQLIPVCNFLTYQEAQNVQAMEDRKTPLYILYVDHERIVLGAKKTSEKLFENDEYGIKFSFLIKNSPILSRDIFITAKVNKIYINEDSSKECFDCIYTNLQEEDLRFLYEKATKRLFI